MSVLQYYYSMFLCKFYTIYVTIQFLNAVSTPRDDTKHSGSKKSLLARRTQYIGHIYLPLVVITVFYMFNAGDNINCI